MVPEQMPSVLTIYYYLIGLFVVRRKVILKLLDSTCFFTFHYSLLSKLQWRPTDIPVELLFFFLTKELR